MVRVPWLLVEVDLPMVWPKTLSQLINVCYYYVVFPLYNNKAPVRPVVFVSFIMRSSSYDAVFFVPVPLYYF